MQSNDYTVMTIPFFPGQTSLVDYGDENYTIEKLVCAVQTMP